MKSSYFSDYSSSIDKRCINDNVLWVEKVHFLVSHPVLNSEVYLSLYSSAIFIIFGKSDDCLYSSYPATLMKLVVLKVSSF